MSLSINDSLSHSNSEDYVTKHAHFDWLVDFKRQHIDGSVTYQMKNITKNNNKLKLDSNHLKINEVLVDGNSVSFDLVEDTIACLGQCLTIPIESKSDKLNVTIRYNTTADGSALQWLKPEATKGKKFPYLFSQCEAIHARCLFPCQDTPSIKFTYSAKVTAVSHLNVLMSAVKTDNVKYDASYKVHSFQQKIPVPSYLIVVVCGNLEGRRVGPRSTIWSEPEMVDEAAAEFQDTEQFLATAEELCGPYVWGVYDVLVLPPSFPYGGMENPCLTFVTPSLLVGDKSLVYVIVHELSHSWTGNLVTNRTWNDFWLNEGHTMYLQCLIMERYYQSEPIRHLLIKRGLAQLKGALTMLGDNSPFAQLVLDLVQFDPDDAYTYVPYEKGQNFLIYLESICGKDKMLRWLKSYLNQFKFQSVSTEQWKQFFWEYMIDVEHVNAAVLDSVDWSDWLYGRGYVPVEPRLNEEYINDSRELALMWATSPVVAPHQELVSRYEALVPLQKYYMFNVLNEELEAQLSHATLQLLGQLYHLTDSKNGEIILGWGLLCIRARYLPAIDQVFTFLNSQGRLRFHKPLYTAFYNWPEMRQRTIDNFESMRPQLHPTTVSVDRRILHLDH